MRFSSALTCFLLDIFLLNLKHSYSINEVNFVFSDQSMKQFLLQLDQTNALGKKFILQELDEEHLFVSSDVLETLEDRVDELMDQLTFTQN